MRLGFCSYYDSFLFCTNKRYRQTFLPRLNRSSILSYPCSNNSHSLSQALIEPSMIDFHTSPIFSVVFIWLVFLGWGLLADVFGCEFLGNLQGGGGFVVNAIEEGIKNFLTLAAKLSDWRWSFVVRVKKILYEVIKLL